MNPMKKISHFLSKNKKGRALRKIKDLDMRLGYGIEPGSGESFVFFKKENNIS